MTDSSQTKLLRIAAFLVDALTISIILILPASAVSYAMAWIGGSVKAIQIVWWAALAILLACILLRDGYRRRSIGKQLLGLRLMTPNGQGCGFFRSMIRNLPLVIPGWNLLEVVLVLFGKPRTGDRIARTTV
ncbi:MAG TPA: RDD family protein, partial [Thermoanaerobaculia bacterium]|nr:RDD family protein [Thermoanaerobaculia bacterium]